MAREFTFEEIEGYLDGTLSPERVVALEKEMKTNTTVAEAIKKHQDAHSLVRHYAINKIKQQVKGIHIQQNQSTSSFSWIKVAASLILLCLVGGYFLIRGQYSSDRLFNRSFDIYPNRFQVMGTQEEDSFLKGLSYYDDHIYREAINIFHTIPDSSEYKIPAQLYSSVSYLALDEVQSAISILSELVKEDTPYTEASRWYLALAYLKNKEEEKAKPLLEALVESKGYQATQAASILNKLNSPWRGVPGVE